MEPNKIRMSSELRNLAKAREFISRKMKEFGVEGSDITKIEISCDEWNANIIEHALGNGAPQEFTIECIHGGDRIMVVYEHRGERFNPLEQEVMNIDTYFSESKERGLGIYIMKEMMDEIHYDYMDGEVNRLTLVKYITPQKT
ncbi:MAG: ATP-binding protein [Spirochaetota bacterium]